MSSSRRLFGLLAALAVALFAGPAAAAGCTGKPAGLEPLICGEPELAALAADLDGIVATSRARAADENSWHDGRRTACPAIAVPSPAPPPGSAQRAVAVACLERLYRQRIAVLRAPQNRAAWPRVPFLPKLVAGAGPSTGSGPLCTALAGDLVAGFRGRGDTIDPLGEREIGFAPQPDLGDEDSPVLRADFDLYNTGKPVVVLEWTEDSDAANTIEYRVFAAPAGLLAAIGRGIEPLSDSVRQAARPWIDRAAVKAGAPRAVFALAVPAPAAQKPRFFTAEGQVYVLAPIDPAAGEPGDLAVFRLTGPARLNRICTFMMHAPSPPPASTVPVSAHGAGFSAPAFAALIRAAGPLTPTGRLCAPPPARAARLKTEAEWRPWVLDRQRWGRDPLALGTLQVYMRNRSFTGPEMARDDRAYQAARNVAIAALAPYYRDTFGRTAAAARRFAALYADRLVADGFEVDPDDSATLALFDPGYADEQKAERAALTGDTAGLRALLGDHPKDTAEMLKGQLDAPLVTDALLHPDTLKMLLALGLDPNARGPYGRTPLMVAARLDLIASARLLIAAGAGPDLGAGDAVAQTDRGGDPQCLGGSGGDTGDTPGRTALSYAVEFASPAFVRLLIDHGASAGQRDSAGRRPADYLKRRQGKAATAATIAALLK
ncbi:MAG: ankyrin repeat domain-containing protein [Stellaceae bacterium]